MLEILTERTHDENDLLSLSLDELAQVGAKKILLQALELEIQETIERCAHLKDSQGRRQVVRNGKGKARKVTIGSGTLEVRAPRINDRREGFSFASKILPRYLRKSPNVESLLPLLYLKGLSGNAFYQCLEELLGEGVSGLSKSSISLLKSSWTTEMEEWNRRKIEEEFVYLWADGVNVKIRIGEDKKLCLLVVMGVTAQGEKKLLAVESGYRESAESWKILFRSLIERGLNKPFLIIGDGALGLWKAVREIPEFAGTKEQRCWVHKIANVLNKLPKRLHPQVKSILHEMMNSETKEDADTAYKTFEKTLNESQYKAVDCLKKDWQELTSFYSFPKAHWKHIRTTNPIESTFSTVKLRMRATKGSGNAKMAEVMAFKLMKEAEKKWNKIRGYKKITPLLSGTLYKNGEPVKGELTTQQETA